MPSISVVGNIRPQSTTTIRSRYSTIVMFFPISPSPPSGSTRSNCRSPGRTRNLTPAPDLAVLGRGRDQAVPLEHRVDGGTLVVGRLYQGQARIAHIETEEIEGRFR